MRHVILFRKGLAEEAEYDAAVQSGIDVYTYRSDIPAGVCVIGRYSVLPYYKELESEVLHKGSCLVNSYAEHGFIADITQWAMGSGPLVGITPRTWGDWSSLSEGSYVLKGKTNSRKSKWNTHMFAPTLADVSRIGMRLFDDPLISDQGIVVREYVPLKTFGHDIMGVPITNEWRTFWMVVDSTPRLIARDFYWASHPEFLDQARWSLEAEAFVTEAARRIVGHATFFVLDVAETVDNGWTVIEVNDGQMSGLSCVDPLMFYSSLHHLLNS
jgi:hypothetical protein